MARESFDALMRAAFAAYEDDPAIGLLTDLANELAVLDSALEGKPAAQRMVDAMRRRIAFVLQWREWDAAATQPETVRAA